jgi:hypothetical protein
VRMERNKDVDEAVIAADDTGMLQEQRIVLETEMAEQLGEDPEEFSKERKDK